MNILLIIGLVIGFGGVIFGYLFDGGVLLSLLKPSSACIVFGGSIGFILLSYPLTYIKEVPKALKLILFRKKKDYAAVISQLFDLANIARKEGIVALESKAEKVSNPFIKKGLQYISDGVHPDFLKTILEHEIEAQSNEYEKAASVFEGAGGVAPAMGVLGTVMGMVSILRAMSADMNELGAKIATAFIATMYGVGSANLIWLSLANHIKNCAREDADYLELIAEGLVDILEGEYPARMRDNLLAIAGNNKGVKEKVGENEK